RFLVSSASATQGLRAHSVCVLCLEAIGPGNSTATILPEVSYFGQTRHAVCRAQTLAIEPQAASGSVRHRHRGHGYVDLRASGGGELDGGADLETRVGRIAEDDRRLVVAGVQASLQTVLVLGLDRRQLFAQLRTQTAHEPDDRGHGGTVRVVVGA